MGRINSFNERAKRGNFHIRGCYRQGLSKRRVFKIPLYIDYHFHCKENIRENNPLFNEVLTLSMDEGVFPMPTEFLPPLADFYNSNCFTHVVEIVTCSANKWFVLPHR
jgi:hypothetical protein